MTNAAPQSFAFQVGTLPTDLLIGAHYFADDSLEEHLGTAAIKQELLGGAWRSTFPDASAPLITSLSDCCR